MRAHLNKAFGDGSWTRRKVNALGLAPISGGYVPYLECLEGAPQPTVNHGRRSAGTHDDILHTRPRSLQRLLLDGNNIPPGGHAASAETFRWKTGPPACIEHNTFFSEYFGGV